MNLLMAVVWMFVGSIVIGYWITSSAMVNSIKDVQNSLTKFYMALFMALWMVVIEINMYAFHSKQYRGLLWLIPVCIGIIGVFLLIRKQVGVGDRNYLKAMIQHHSSAILTSEEILKKTEDPAVIKLANQIIDSQQEEIDLMNQLLN